MGETTNIVFFILGDLRKSWQNIHPWWQGKHGTVLMFSLKDRQWQVSHIYMIFLAALQTADLKLKDWSISKSISHTFVT